MLALLALALPARGQDAAPTLSALDALKLQAMELALENLTLRLDALRRDTQDYLRTLQQPGYELRKERGADGVARWVYRPVPDPSTTPPPPPRQE